MYVNYKQIHSCGPGRCARKPVSGRLPAPWILCETWGGSVDATHHPLVAFVHTLTDVAYIMDTFCTCDLVYDTLVFTPYM